MLDRLTSSVRSPWPGLRRSKLRQPNRLTGSFDALQVFAGVILSAALNTSVWLLFFIYAIRLDLSWSALFGITGALFIISVAALALILGDRRDFRD